MYCPTCGNEIATELKYCNRCGANLALPTSTTTKMVAAPKLALPSIVLGFTIIAGLAIIFGGASGFAREGIHPARDCLDGFVQCRHPLRLHGYDDSFSNQADHDAARNDCASGNTAGAG